MKKKIIVLGALSVVTIITSFLFAIWLGGESQPSPAQENLEATRSEVVVYVSGQVKTPAVVTLEDNGNLRLVDAVNAVGGLTELADTEFVNLAEPLIDGQHVHIPTKDIFYREIAAQASSSSSNLVNINTADEKELQKIKGVGPAIAGRIIEYRENNGAFKTIDEIKKVRGIGDKTFDKLKDQITV